MLFAKKSTATTTVKRVRFRSTMCVPPCEAGREAHAAHARVAAAVHQHERDEHEDEEHLDDCEKADHRPPG